MPVDVDAVLIKVQRILTEDETVAIDRDGNLTIPLHSVDVRVRVDAHPNGRATLVSIEAPVLHAVKPSPELDKHIAFQGHRWIFGRLGLSMREDGLCDVTVSHTLLGDFLDREELRYVVHGIARSVETADDALLSQFGGALPGASK